MQTTDSESVPQEFHLRVDLTRPPSLVATAHGAWHRFNARLLTGRGVVFPQPVMAYFMRCCRTIRSQKEQAAHPLRGQQAESIC